MPGANILPYKGKSPSLGQRVFLAAGAQLIGDLEVGEDSSFWFNTVVRADCNYIRIGQRSNIQDGTVIHVTNSLFPTHIGDEVTVGHNATLHGCRIGDRCLIGMGAVVMDDVNVGRHSIVAAGALLTPGKTYPEGHLIKGSPAKAVRALRPAELESLERSYQYYLEYKSHYVPHSS